MQLWAFKNNDICDYKNTLCMIEVVMRSHTMDQIAKYVSNKKWLKSSIGKHILKSPDKTFGV